MNKPSIVISESILFGNNQYVIYSKIFVRIFCESYAFRLRIEIYTNMKLKFENSY